MLLVLVSREKFVRDSLVVCFIFENEHNTLQEDTTSCCAIHGKEELIVIGALITKRVWMGRCSS